MGKIQPFKAVGSALSTVAPIAGSLGIKGYAPWMGLAGSVVGSMLQGGGKKSKGGGLQTAYGASMNPVLQQIMQRQLGLADQGSNRILDFSGREGEFRTNALFGGAQAAESAGARAAQMTGNDFMRAAVGLNNQNAANEQANAFGRYLFGPQGQAEAYGAAQGLYSAPFGSAMGIENLGLQREQLHNQRVATNKQFARPSFFESLGGTVLGSAPYLIQNWGSIFGPKRTSGGTNYGSNTSSGGTQSQVVRAY